EQLLEHGDALAQAPLLEHDEREVVARARARHRGDRRAKLGFGVAPALIAQVLEAALERESSRARLCGLLRRLSSSGPRPGEQREKQERANTSYHAVATGGRVGASGSSATLRPPAAAARAGTIAGVVAFAVTLA